MNPILETIRRLFRERGDEAYIGEKVSQTEHALQAAWAAEKSGATPELITAALLHDVGHILDLEYTAGYDPLVDLQHENAGARWLEERFVPAVYEPVHLHVAAKRYLCATDPTYHDLLSEASRASLRAQKGPFSPTEAQEFEAHPFYRSAVELRRWDDIAKIPGLATPSLEHFLPFVEKSLA